MNRWGLTTLLVLLLLAPLAHAQGSLTDTLNASIGAASRADIIQKLGPPDQALVVDEDHFLIYLFRESNAWLDAGDILKGFAGSREGPHPRKVSQLILRFDGTIGKLKAWNIRQ